MATHGYMSDGDPLCHSIALNLTLSPARSVGPLSCLDHSALYPSLFFFFSRCLHICVGEDICIPSVLLMHFCRWISGKRKPHAKWFTWQPIVCTHWPSKLLLFRFHHHRHVPCIQQWTLLCAVVKVCLSHSLQSRGRKWSERERHNPVARINVSQVLCETTSEIKLDVCLGWIFLFFFCHDALLRLKHKATRSGFGKRHGLAGTLTDGDCLASREKLTTAP